MIFSDFTQSALSLGRLTLWQYKFTSLNKKGALPAPQACKSALVPRVSPWDCWKPEMIHHRQGKEESEVGAEGETYALEEIESQTPGAKENLSDHLA